MELLTVVEVAEILKCSKQHVWALINGRGESLHLPAIKIGKSYRIYRHELEEFIESQKVK